MILMRTGRPLIDARHALGHAKIDADHFAIADCWRQATTCPLIAAPFQIARLRKRMRRHFDDEAALIEAAGAPFCACHREEHDAMLGLCDEAYLLSGTDTRRACALLRRRLPGLMRAHIDGMDQIAVLIMNAEAEARALADLHR
jgi:hemerythrin